MADLSVLGADTFDAAVQDAGNPILIDFWAPWCGSCRLLMPAVTSIAEELSDDLRVAKVDVDQHPELAARLGVMSIPTLIMYRDGAEVLRVNGVKSRSALLGDVTAHLTAPAAG